MVVVSVRVELPFLPIMIKIDHGYILSLFPNGSFVTPLQRPLSASLE